MTNELQIYYINKATQHWTHGVCMSYQLHIHAYGNLMEVSHDVSKLLLKLLIKQFKVNQCDLGRVVKAID